MADSSARHWELVGGARSSKTFLLVSNVCSRAIRAPGSRHLIVRMQLNAVRQSIWLDTFPKVIKLRWPGLNEKLDYHSQDSYIKFPNGSEVWMLGLDDKERVEKILGKEFCVAPESRILKADLTWVPADTIKVGDELIAFPENLDGHMKLVRSVVTHARVVRHKRYRITTTRGETIVSAEHKFVAYKDDRRTKNFRSLSWVEANALNVGDQIRFACKAWETGSSYDDGWLAGLYDGEGWVGKQGACGVAQNPGPVLDRAAALLEERDVPVRQHGEICQQLIPRSLWDSLRVLGIVRPTRLLPQASKIWEGKRGFIARGSAAGHSPDAGPINEDARHVATITKIEALDEGPVVSLTTSSRTLIADGFLGHNCTLYFNECSQIPYATVTVVLTRLAQLAFDKEGVPIPTRAYYDLNPVGTAHWTHKLFIEKRSPENRALIANPNDYEYAFMNPEDNRENLAEGYIDDTLKNLPERQRRRFYEGKYVSEIDGALWPFDVLEAQRVSPEDLPNMQRIVIGVDPSGAADEFDLKADEIGIVVGGLGVNGHGYVLEDATGLYSPAGWARKVDDLYKKWRADRVVAEKNFGGAMVESTLKTFNKSMPVRMVTASRGKVIRAEPISAMYEQKKCWHAGRFHQLEDEMANMTTSGYKGSGSPNRVDAWVYSATELFGKNLLFGLSGYMREEQVKVDKAKEEAAKEIEVAKIERIGGEHSLAKPETGPLHNDGCKACGSKAIGRVNGKRYCNQCGTYQDQPPVFALEPIKRGDLLK